MDKLFQATLERLRKGERVVWCVILSAQGSTPRGVGAKMAVFEDGKTVGTVGGGAVEYRALELAKTMGDRAFVQGFDLHSGGSEALGMVCGGRVEIGFLPFPAQGAEPMADALKTLCVPGNQWLRIQIGADGSFVWGLIPDQDVHSVGERLPMTPLLQRLPDGGWRLTEPVSGQDRVYIFGGGHVSAALAPVLLPLGFPVTVYDSRPELAVPARFPGAEVVLGDFESLSPALRLTERDYAVVMTPGHTMDLDVLRQVLRTPVTYVGCIGSRRKTAYVNQALREEGFSEAEIARIHAPIGLPIGARTPEEIAISVAAELIQHRASLRI